MADPVPFEIVTAPDGTRVASNGELRVAVFDKQAHVCRHRRIVGLPTRPAGETILPKINEFAGTLLANIDMPAEQVKAHLLALAGTIQVIEPTREEYLRVEINGVYIYTDGQTVMISNQPLHG